MDALGNVSATIGHNLFATMFPFQFLKLCPKYSYGDDDWFDKQVNERIPYGIPFLKVDVDKKNKQLIVTNHEGRHRVASIKRRNPNVDIPVAILYNKDRYILPDINTLRKEWSIISEDGKNKFNIGQFSLYNEFPEQSKHDLYDIYKENLNESKYTVKDITFYEDPSVNWIKAQLNNDKVLRVAINGDLDEPYFSQWVVWDAMSANHQKALNSLGMDEEDNICLRLSKDTITYWGYTDEQIAKLKECQEIQKIYPNGYKLRNEW